MISQSMKAAAAGKRLEQYVREARAGGATWQSIAAELGVSRQAAWAKFHKRVSAHAGSGAEKLPLAPPNRSTKLAQTAEQQVVQERAAGATWQSIAGKLGVSRQAAWARYHAVSPTPPPKMPSHHEDEIKAKVAQWRQNGLSWRKISKRLNRSHQAIWSRFAEISFPDGPQIPEAVLDACSENPVRFRNWAEKREQSDPQIYSWLRRLDPLLGLVTGHERPVAPLELLGTSALREFLLTTQANRQAQRITPSAGG
jgi:hypothetical protein